MEKINTNYQRGRTSEKIRKNIDAARLEITELLQQTPIKKATQMITDGTSPQNIIVTC